MEILPEQMHQWYEMDVSFLYWETNRTLRVFQHVPCYRRGSMMDLHEYVPTPLTVSSDLFFLPKPVHQILAVSKRDQTTFRPMTREDLGLCHHTGSMYFCPRKNYNRKLSESSCLMALFQHRTLIMAEKCRYQPMEARGDYIRQLGPNKFVLFQAKENMVSLSCPGPHNGGYVPTTRFQGVRELYVPAGCRANTISFVFTGEVDIFVQEELLAPLMPGVNVSDIFPVEVMQAETSAIMAEISKIGSPEGVKVKDIATMLRNTQTESYIQIGSGVLGLITFLMFIFGFFWVCKRTNGCGIVNLKSMRKAKREVRRERRTDQEFRRFAALRSIERDNEREEMARARSEFNNRADIVDVTEMQPLNALEQEYVRPAIRAPSRRPPPVPASREGRNQVAVRTGGNQVMRRTEFMQ